MGKHVDISPKEYMQRDLEHNVCVADFAVVVRVCQRHHGGCGRAYRELQQQKLGSSHMRVTYSA